MDAALARLQAEMPGWRIFSMGERPKGSAYASFFCGLERRSGGGKVSLGEARTLPGALANAIQLAKEDH